MKETNEDNTKEEEKENLIEEPKKEEAGPNPLSKLVSQSERKIDEEEKKRNEKLKEMSNSSFYYIKDYIFFFSIMICSSMNFSYPYLPLILIGLIQNYFIGKNGPNEKTLKFRIELLSMIYSVVLLLIKIIVLLMAKSDDKSDIDFISKYNDLLLDIGICHLRDKNSNFYFVMTFLGEIICFVFSLYSIIISGKCKQFKWINDTSSYKSTFWTTRKLIFLNYVFIASFAVFNTSFLTLFYLFLLQILFFLNSIKANAKILDKLFKIILDILLLFILIQVALINVFNVPWLQENVLHTDDITDKDGNLKVYSIYTKIGINYSYNDKLSNVWKEWAGYFFAILSLVSISLALDNIKANELNMIKIDDLSIKENSDDKLISTTKEKQTEIQASSNPFFNFICSPVFIIQFCRVMSIFYIYFYSNFFSLGIFITLFFSSIYLDVNKNKNLTLYILAPMVTITIFFYQLSNINGIFENYEDKRRKKYLNFALGKYEYSYLEGYAHHLFFIFIMFLIYSFYDIRKETKIKKMIIEKDLSINEDEKNEPLLINTNDVENENIIQINNNDQPEEEIIINRKEDELTFWNILLKYIFSQVDKIILIAMYFVSMRSINLIHLVLVIIFIIQILLPMKIHKIYLILIWILQILFCIELLIHILKAYLFDQFNDNKDVINFILTYTDKILDNDIELGIFLVIYCFYFQYQLNHNFPYIKKVIISKNITLEKYVDDKFINWPGFKYLLKTLGAIISNLYIWVLIGVFFVFSCYFEINFIFTIILGYFLILSYHVLRRIQNRKNGKKFSLIVHYIFLIFCSIYSFLVYLYQFRGTDLISSKIDYSSDNFFVQNLPNIGFSIYQNDYLYFNFLPHFGNLFISVLFVNEIYRQYKIVTKKEIFELKIMDELKAKKEEINKKLKKRDLSEEDKELYQSDEFEANKEALGKLSSKYICSNITRTLTKFYWLFLYLSIGIIFSYYDLSFSMVIYIIIFGIIFILMFYRRIINLTKYINKPHGSYFVSKAIRYTLVEKKISNSQTEYYRSIAFKYLLIYNFIFIILFYLYGVFDLFQHGCNDKFFKGCESSNDPIFEPNGNAENYIRSFAFLFGIYVDIRKEGLINVAWVHILLSLLIGLDIYCQKLEKKYTMESKIIRDNLLVVSNEMNTLFRYFGRRDINVGIKIGLKLAGIPSSEEVIKKMEQAYIKDKEEKQKKKLAKKKKEKIDEEKKEKEEEDKIKEEPKNINIIGENKNEINTKTDNKEVIDVKQNKYENLPGYEFLNNKSVKKFLNLFSEVENNKQRLSDTNNNSTKVIWFVKKLFEELIIVLLICIALTKLNILSFIYVIYYIYLTTTKKTMYKFFILYIVLLILILIQSIIYVTNISEETCPRSDSDILQILKDTLYIPWYENRLNIEKKYAYFYGFGINKTQMGLLLLEYCLIALEYIYFDYFSFSIYQDTLNKGEEKETFKFGKDKLGLEKKKDFQQWDQKLFTQYKECLSNFNVNIGNDINEMIAKLCTDEKKHDGHNKKNLKASNSILELFIYFRNSEKEEDLENNKVPDSEFTKSVQEFFYLYLHIFFLFLIIIISIMITGLISMFYLLISFFYLINSHKIYLGLKYGYPKYIKSLIKYCLIVDIFIQILYQIPYISPGENSTIYKVFNTLGFSKLLNYIDNSKVEIETTGIIEIIGKPLIYLIISLQTIIYNSLDFKKYYIIFLLNIKKVTERIGFINSFIFNNARINEFSKSAELRLDNEMRMDKIKEKILELSKEIEGMNLLDEDSPLKDPLQYFKDKDKEKKEKEKKDESKDKVKIEKKIELIENKEEDKKEEIIEEIKEEDKSEKSEEIKLIKKDESLLDDIKKEGALALVGKVGEKIKAKKRKIITPEKIKERLKKILLGGKLMNLYMWFSMKSTSSFKSMEAKNRENFRISSFKNIPIKCFIENEIDELIQILDLSNFDHKEVTILEDFCKKFRDGKLDEEILKIKNKIKESRQNKIKGENINNDNEIIINNNNEENNNINGEDLKNIEVEYNIKKGGTEININTLKFKQFYYLLDANVFKYYFVNSYLVKTIFSILGSFISSNFDYFIYLIMIIDHMINSSILSLFYPLSIFCYALLENPRPKRTYWQVCLFYTILVLIVKFIFQLKLFVSIMESEQYLKFVDVLYNYKIGIKYFDNGFGVEFFVYIIFDALLLLLLSINKNILISNGLWDKREEQIENIYLANERVEKFKNINFNEAFGFIKLFFSEYLYRIILNIFEEKRDKIKEENKKTNEGGGKDEKNKNGNGKDKTKTKEEEKKEAEKKEAEKKEEEKKEEEKKEEEDDEDDVDEIETLNKDDQEAIVSFYYNKMYKEARYDEGSKNYFNKLFPKIRNEKPGIDKYPFLAISLILVIIYILLFFTQMAQDKNYGPVTLSTTQFSGNMVLFLILHVFIFVFDRIIYISQNRTDLKYKYFIYKKNKGCIGKAITKTEYNKIKQDYGYEEGKPFHFTPGLIRELKEKDYNLFYIQTENFNKPLFQKYLLHLFTIVISHGFAFFYFPMIGNYNSFNSIYCNEEEPQSCNDFNKNVYTIFFYILYLFYLYFSSAQIRLGYYDIKRKSLFKRNTPITNIIASIFNAIPFLPQIRHVLDWTYTTTSFDLFQWIKFESIYNSIFGAFKESNENDDAPIGKKVEQKKQKSFGNILSFVLIMILVVPLILYSSLNPTNKLNNIIGGKLTVDLSFIYDNDVKLNYNLFENTRTKSIDDMFKNDNDTIWKNNNYDQSAQTMNFEHDQIQIIKFSETSDRNWDLAEPHIKDLIEMLNVTNNNDLKFIELKISIQFERPLPAEAQTVSLEFNLTIYNSSNASNSSEEIDKIYELKNALEKCQNVEIEYDEGYTSPLRFKSSDEVTEIEDHKNFYNKTIQLGFQGCEIEQKILINETKFINNYLRSYFTFKSKNKNDTEFSGIEFHAFNDKISETISGYSVISFYVTFILVAGKYVADYLSSEPEKIMYTDLPHPEIIIDLCEGITIARYNNDFKDEESLYTLLIELMRSPDILKKLTQSSITNLEIRKQNNIENEEDNEEEDNDSVKENVKDNDDENDDYYDDDKKENPNDKNKKKEEDKKNENIKDKKEEEIMEKKTDKDGNKEEKKEEEEKKDEENNNK